VYFKLEYLLARRILTKMIAMTSVIDDIYCNVQMPRTENNNNIKIKEIFLETIPPPHVPHLPHKSPPLNSFPLELSHSPITLPLSFIFCFFFSSTYTHTFSPTLSFGHSSLFLTG
jgi:hypothetical protein